MFENVRYISCGNFVSDGDWIHPDRSIDSFEIIFVTKGNVYINENGKEYALGKKECLILEPGIRHFGYKKSRDTEFFWLHWSGRVDTDQKIKHTKIADSYSLSLFFKELLHSRIKKSLPERLDYLTRLILGEVYSSDTTPAPSDIAQSVALYIKSNAAGPISVKELSTRFGYNPDYLNRTFRQSFGKSIKQYVDEERIQYIKSLMLNEKMSLKEVAKKAGFDEYKYFLKFFKYHEKYTPKEFQKLYSVVYINSR